MKLHSRIRSLQAAVMATATAILASAVLLAPAQAGQTSIAQVPLLNITGTGSVKPNLMLLFDNSGSMDYPYLPDSVGSGSVKQCRGRAALRDLTSSNTLCAAGQPPFMSSDFNHIYYNPAIRYQPPIKFDGNYYPDIGSPWTAVPVDGFASRGIDLFGNNLGTSATTNLVTGFPDINWCDGGSPATCKRNTATYTYPDATYVKAVQVTGNPYYYTIGVAQFCSDEELTKCVSTSVGAAAPSGYPYPVKVRWCDTVNLNNCQAKQVGAFTFPSFSIPAGSQVAYGTFSIGTTTSTKQMQINSVTMSEPSTQTVISTATVAVTSGKAAAVAPNGTDTIDKQQALASLMAAAIMSKTGTPTQYWACVRTPIGTNNVLPCANYGINLTADNIVAVIPLDCASTSNKLPSNCAPATDNANDGWGIAVDAPAAVVTAAVYVPPTAVISVTGSGNTANSGTPSLASITWNGVTLASGISIGKNVSATSVASNIVNAVNGNTGSTGFNAYVGGNAITPACAAKAKTDVCLVNKTANSNLDTPSLGKLSGNASLVLTPSAGSGYVSTPQVTEAIPVKVQAIKGGTVAASTFSRVDIVSTNNSYPRGAARTDCAGSSCTYIEEMTNFANWYAYYHTRIQMTKTAVGLAFAPVTANYRVGLSRMSSSGNGGSIEIKPADFTGTARQTWYSTFYATTTSGSTPTRVALDNVGKMFANIGSYAYTTGNEVVQYPCQQNFVLLTTDGYWNLGYNSGTAANNDNVENAARFCTAGRACVDTRSQGAPSLADIALYWYNGGSNSGTASLRPSIDDMSKPGLVPGAAGENTHLHVTTFTLGLGIDGVMNYESNYDTAPKVGGDFYNLLTGAASGCPWNGGGAYVWPDPQTGTSATSTASVQERVDDLWHAAINGHGKYFSANEPRAVQDGLSQAIAAISVRVGAASAAATSTPNISQQDKDIFSAVFTTGRWFGELSDKKIDIITGNVGRDAAWNTSDRLGLAVAASTDSRTIKMLDTSTNTLKDFKYSAMSSTEKAWFDNKCSLLPQCALLSAADKLLVNSGTNVVNWLRGQQQYADDQVFRAYSQSNPASGSPLPIVLGDIASSKPAFVRGATKSYSTAGYSAYKIAQAERKATVYAAANDGMLHAFSADTGDESWAYVPRITMQKLYKQVSTTYATNHQFSTDGSPEVADVQFGTVWRTVLVAGLNGGGRGYYALDVTDPANPSVLWELCADPAVCSKNDADIGLTFGNPQFGMWQGKWVVFLTSGYNNVSGVDGIAVGTSGHGFLYIVDIASGAILKKVDTTPLAAPTTGTPAGLAKITSISTNPFTDPVTTYIYGGDNQGQMWRFDLTSASPGVVGVVKMGDAGSSQPLTSGPEVTQCLVTETVAGVSTQRAQRVVLFGSGRLLDISDTTDNSTQSLYMLKDTGSPIANIRGASMVQQNLSTVGSTTNSNTYGITSRKVDLAIKDGWYVDFNLNQGERINLDPQVVAGGINIVTNTPTSSSSCSVGGSSNVYQFAVCSGNAVTVTTPTELGKPDVIATAGSTLSTSSAAVGFIIVRLPSGSIKMITTTADGNTITTNVTPPNSLSSRKVGWRGVTGE